jgi:hypothetical protein
MRTEILNHYMKVVNTEEKEPQSVFRFCEELNIKEADFYEEFSDLESVKEAILSEMWLITVNALEAQSFYQEAPATDKLLSVLYAFVEQLKQQRSYFLIAYKNWSKPTDNIKGINEFRHTFTQYVDSLDLDQMEIGIGPLDKATGKLNQNALFANVLFVFHFWLNDRSKGFEKTDACIEKVFTLSFELMGNQTLKKAIDLGKFLLSQK